MKIFDKITIIGVGLIGGSIGLAVKKKGLAGEVVGLCRREESAQKALECKAVDKATLDVKEAVEGSNLIIIATPVGKIIDRAKEVIKYAGNAILIDVGSTKEAIVNKIEKIIPSNIKFVGTHPMAGSEKSGVLYARDNLFLNSICIVTKTKKTDPEALDTVKKFWNELGARCEELSPDKHDRYISFVSHLPHVAAVALTIEAEGESLKYASTGFKDTTRIAASNPALWQDILISNKKALLDSLDDYIVHLQDVRTCIKKGDRELLIELLKKAKEIREKLK